MSASIMILAGTRDAVAAAYRRGELIKDIAQQYGVSPSSVTAIARASGAPRRYLRAKKRLGPLPLAGPTTRQRGALSRLRKIKLMRLAMLRSGRVADRQLAAECA